MGPALCRANSENQPGPARCGRSIAGGLAATRQRADPTRQHTFHYSPPRPWRQRNAACGRRPAAPVDAPTHRHGSRPGRLASCRRCAFVSIMGAFAAGDDRVQAWRTDRSSRKRRCCRDEIPIPDRRRARAGLADRAAAEDRVCRRRVRAAVREPRAIAGGHDPVGSVHRRAGQSGDVAAVSRAGPRRAIWRKRSPQDLERAIHSTGFFRTKAKNIRACCAELASALRRAGAARPGNSWCNCREWDARRPTWCWAPPTAWRPEWSSIRTWRASARRLALTPHKDPREDRTGPDAPACPGASGSCSRIA